MGLNVGPELDLIPRTIASPGVAEDCESLASKGAKGDQNLAWQPSAIAADIVTLGAGTLLAGLFNAAIVFVVPKLLSVEAYGYWRLFVLYSGYVGFLHFGFADGALLRWAGKSWGEFHHEIGPAAKYLLWQHVLVIAPLCFAALLLPRTLWFVAIGICLFSFVMNEVTLLQMGLQCGKIFRPFAISNVAAPGLFLAFVLAWYFAGHVDYRLVICSFIAGWLCALIFLLVRTKPWPTGDQIRVRPVDLVENCLRAGWPIVLANTGVNLIQYADRLAVSWAASIQNFALYSLAASAMGVPITIIQACSSVFFSHLADIDSRRRKQVYTDSTHVLLFAWALLLPYYFALDAFVHRFLPHYVPSIEYARILLLGVPFIAVVQILQMNYAYLSGMQRRFFVQTACMLVASLAITAFAAFELDALRMVAEAQVIALALWWLSNEWTIRRATGVTAQDQLGFMIIYVLVSLIYWFTSGFGFGRELMAICVYYPVICLIFAAAAWGKLRIQKKQLA
jgi:O-antigen/teichoic acid export membrane protein